MRLQVGGVYHDRCRVGANRSQPLHHPREHAYFTPAFPSVVERLVRAVGARRVSPAQPVPVDEYDAAQHPSVIDARLAVASRKERSQPFYLLFRQPKQVAHASLLTEPESDRGHLINGS